MAYRRTSRCGCLQIGRALSTPLTPTPPLFPYTTLFRSGLAVEFVLGFVKVDLEAERLRHVPWRIAEHLDAVAFRSEEHSQLHSRRHLPSFPTRRSSDLVSR